MQIRLTKAAVEKLKNELTKLEGQDRPRVADRIKSARAYGDLSENYEYHAAKEEQGMLEARIREIRAVLGRAHVVESRSKDSDIVGLGSVVTVFDREAGKEMKFTIVTMVDADPVKGRISEQSPIGQALSGKKVGDVLEFQVPAGKHHLEIKAIEHEDI